MNPIYKDAIKMAGKIRRKTGFGMFAPLNVFDLCIKLGITVRFVDVSMEGFYVNQGGNPTILISNQRPFPRRYFTCGHELGHHVFGHGLRLDTLSEEREGYSFKDPDEVLVDAFASALLMPVAAIQSQFAKRNWNIEQSTPLQFYTICSVFGVGFSTLVRNCSANGLISDSKAETFLKLTPAKIFETTFGDIGSKSYFKVLDKYTRSSVVDLEVSNYLAVPSNVVIDENGFEKLLDSISGTLYRAKKSGIFTAHYTDSSDGYFIRIQPENYVGLSEYRHFEN